MNRTYERGAVVMVNLEPVVGSEQGRVRPCVVVSDLDAVRASRSKPVYVVVPFARLTLRGCTLRPVNLRTGNSVPFRRASAA